jgi:hypothetical protein
MSIKTVFISSTVQDLAKYRKAAYQAIESLDGYHAVCMEDFGARDWESDEFCREKVATCDLFVGIVGHLYGSCPPGTEQSYTEHEYEAAISAGIPRLICIAPEDFPLAASLREPDDKWQRQRVFRQRVSRDRIRDTFTTPENLAWRVVQAIRNWEREQSTTQQIAFVVRPKGVTPLPPQPHFVHPYPLQENFVGRINERKMLTEWFSQDQRPLLALIALGAVLPVLSYLHGVIDAFVLIMNFYNLCLILL